MAAWTQITGSVSQTELTGLARFIVAGTGGQSVCSGYTLDVSGQTKKTALFMARNNVATAEFPITVCETSVDTSWANISLIANGKPVTLWEPNETATGPVVIFPALHSVGRRNKDTINLISVGDTGCRDNSDQSCDTVADWPFEALSDAAVGNSPDFILHVGDYRYSHKGENDQWKYWYEEFFYPAQKLLKDAPWAFVRGNHEACGYQGTDGLPAPWGTGWFYFLQHNDVANSQSCIGGGAPYQELWYFDVGVQIKGGAVDSHRIIVMDSSTDTPTQVQTDNFVTMLKYSDAVDSSWWTGHRPIWGINPYSPVSALEADLEQSLTSALMQYDGTSTCWQSKGLSCSLKTVIAGRIQFFGSGAAAKTWLRPQQYVTGNSGVVLSPAMNTSPCSFTIAQSNPSTYGPMLTATVDWAAQFGYTLWQRPAVDEPSGWKEIRYFLDSGNIVKVDPAKLGGDQQYPVCE